MIDVENQIYTSVATALKSAFDGINVQGVITYAPSKFPTVCIEEFDNYALRYTRDSGSNENFVQVAYEVDVYSNKVPGGKEECKKIFGVADKTLQDMGFTRTSKTFLQSGSNQSRMIGRYSAVIGKDNMIYWG